MPFEVDLFWNAFVVRCKKNVDVFIVFFLPIGKIVVLVLSTLCLLEVVIDLFANLDYTDGFISAVVVNFF